MVSYLKINVDGYLTFLFDCYRFIMMFAKAAYLKKEGWT